MAPALTSRSELNLTMVLELRSVVRKDNVESFAEKPVSNGPFELVQRADDRGLRLVGDEKRQKQTAVGEGEGQKVLASRPFHEIHLSDFKIRITAYKGQIVLIGSADPVPGNLACRPLSAGTYTHADFSRQVDIAGMKNPLTDVSVYCRFGYRQIRGCQNMVQRLSLFDPSGDGQIELCKLQFGDLNDCPGNAQAGLGRGLSGSGQVEVLVQKASRFLLAAVTAVW